MVKTSKFAFTRMLAIAATLLWVGTASSQAGPDDNIEALPQVFGQLSWQMAPESFVELFPNAFISSGSVSYPGPDGNLLPGYSQQASTVELPFFGRSRVAILRNLDARIEKVVVESSEWEIPCVDGLGATTRLCHAAYNDELLNRFAEARRELTRAYGPPDRSEPIPETTNTRPHHVPQTDYLWNRRGFDLWLGIITRSDGIQVVIASAHRR